MANCLMCKRELDVPGDIESRDCGGDCLKCLSDCFDLDAIHALEWKMVVFSSDCDEYGNCPVCGDQDFGDCPCPGPTQDGYEYKERDGKLWARKGGEDDAN